MSDDKNLHVSPTLNHQNEGYTGCTTPDCCTKSHEYGGSSFMLGNLDLAPGKHAIVRRSSRISQLDSRLHVLLEVA